MSKKRSNVVVQTFQLPGMLIEKYFYSAGSIEPLPKHSHQEYQLGMSLDCQGEYYYRGAYHSVPTGKLSIIHSGEVHSPSERTHLPQPASFLMMQIEPTLLTTTAMEIGKDISVPFFTQPVFSDRTIAQLFYRLCTSDRDSNLAQDSLLLDFLSYLVTPKQAQILDAGKKTQSTLKTTHNAIAIVCDYLHANYADNVSLAELANIAGISRFYLSRLFRRQQGISLSAYQTQIKIDRAKQLLAQGMSISAAATATGFYDQSHFGHHFKRLVGTTPGKYGNIQYE